MGVEILLVEAHEPLLVLDLLLEALDGLRAGVEPVGEHGDVPLGGGLWLIEHVHKIAHILC